MNPAALQENDNVARLVPLSKLRDDGSPDTEAFRIHPDDQQHASVDWLEYFDASRSLSVSELLTCVVCFYLSSNRRKVTKNSQAKFAVLAVGTLLKLEDSLKVLRVPAAEGLDLDSHSGIFHSNSDAVLEAIRNCVHCLMSVPDVYPKD